MSTHKCDTAWCTRPADIKVGDVGLCGKHYKQYVGWSE